MKIFSELRRQYRLTEHFPQAVHNRHRRSIGDKSTAWAEGDKRDEIGMAAKSSLTEKVLPVVDLQSQGGEATKDLDGEIVGYSSGSKLDSL